MVGPGALKPSDGDGIKSRRPLLHSRHSRIMYLDLLLLFLLLSFSLNICTYCGVCNNNNNIYTFAICARARVI